MSCQGLKDIKYVQWWVSINTYHHGYWASPGALVVTNPPAKRKAEKEISEDYNINEDYVFINIAAYPRFDEMKTQVDLDGKLYPLTEISNIISALSKARFNIPDISLYVPEDEKEKFEKFKLEQYLDLPEIDKEKFHGIHYDQIKLF